MQKSTFHHTRKEWRKGAVSQYSRLLDLFTGLGLPPNPRFLVLFARGDGPGVFTLDRRRRDAPVEGLQKGIFVQRRFVCAQVLFERDFKIGFEKVLIAARKEEISAFGEREGKAKVVGQEDSLLQAGMVREASELAFSLLLQPVDRTRHDDGIDFLDRVINAINIVLILKARELY